MNEEGDMITSFPKGMNYLNLKQFIVSLGMSSEYSANTDSNERILLYDIWKILDGEVKEQIMIEDLRVLLMAIMRITDHKRIGVERPSNDDENTYQTKRLTSQSNLDEVRYGVGFFNDKGQYSIP